jgi:hypothetical protein
MVRLIPLLLLCVAASGPPLPSTVKLASPKAASEQQNAVMAAPAIVIAPPKPQVLTLAWNYSPWPRLTNCVTVLQFSTNLTTWTQLATVRCALTNSFSITNAPPSLGFFHAYTLDTGTGLTSK